jgi:hypothetical protein
MHVTVVTFKKPITVSKEPRTIFHRLLAKLKKDERLTVNQATARIGGIKDTIARLLRRTCELGYARSVQLRKQPTKVYEATAKLYKAKDLKAIHRK